MRIVILATEEQKEEITSTKNIGYENDLIFIKSVPEIKIYTEVDAFFLLHNRLPGFEPESILEKPVIINSVVHTLESVKLPANYSRINAWPGFLKRPIWEIASNNKTILGKVFKSLGWNILFVKDEPGFITARVISMIINEAYFALAEDVSTISEINLAMKLGTNYPMGPFEWQNTIGIENIFFLLKKLSETNKRYLIAPLLEDEFKKFTALQKQ